MIAGFVKAFGVSFEYAVNEVSYVNMVLYGATLPSYGDLKADKKKGKGVTIGDEVIKADDPKNRELVRAILRGYKF